MTINGLTLKATPLSTDRIELGDGQGAQLSALPVSTPTTTAIAAAKADCVQLTGNQTVAGIKTFSSSPVVPTAAAGTNTTQAASTAFVQQELAAGGSTARALVVEVRNQSGGTMTAGTVVYINGATGNLPTIAKALGTGDATSAQTIGLVQTSIVNNGTGLVVIRGIVSGLNTQSLTEGQQLYLSSTVAGAYTTTKQYAPNHLVYVGIVTSSHPTLGSIEVAIQNGYELDEIHDVSAQNPTNGDTLRFNSTTGLWEKSALGTLATQSGTFSGTSSGTNTGDQTISLTGDVTGSGTGSFAATIAANAVTNAKAAQVATQTFKGRNTAGTGNAEDLSVATVKTMLAISNVNNTSDANKPVSTAQQTALNLKADLASPSLTGTPTAPTASANTNSTQISTTAYAYAADIASKAALIEREGLRFDGTAGAVATGPVLGSSDYTISGVAKVDSLTGTQTIVGSIAGGFTLVVNSSGNIVASLQGTGTLGTSSGTVTAGTPFFFSVVRSGTTGTFYINGVASGTFTDASVYTTGITLLGASTGAVNYLNGTLAGVKPLNYALTQAEITALIGRGLVTLPEQRGGSMTALNTTTFVNGGDAGEIPFGTFSGASATGFTGNAGGVTARAVSSPFAARLGQKFKVTFTLAGTLPSVVFVDNGANGDLTGGAYNITLASGVNTFTFTSTDNTTARFQVIASASGSLTVSAVSVIPLGTLFEQDSGQRNAGYMVRDTSGNNLDLILPATGVSVIDPAMRGVIRFTTSTSGNQQIGGTQVIIPTNARISSWVINSSGTPNVTLGNVSAGAHYRASAAVVSGNNQITLLTPFTATGNLWVNSSTTATLKHTIMWEYIQ